MLDRILVCDDDPAVRGFLSRLLAHHGFRVHTVESGQQALDDIARHPPDVLPLDVGMPGLDGIETCRRVRADPGCDLLPIVLITGLS